MPARLIDGAGEPPDPPAAIDCEERVPGGAGTVVLEAGQEVRQAGPAASPVAISIRRSCR
ncbi:hypothetical protein [Methylobacterium durans]|uniref:hypothetical protein n=1 Tax=Methylobacterium durans TaxID=2202825 RepID=UPI0013A54C49|nr:hypothetical protein [Methylobacterium durans]